MIPLQVNSEPIFLQKEGVFDFQKIYSNIVNFLQSLQYLVVEKKHIFRTRKGYSDLLLEFECTKEIDEYFQNQINVKIFIDDMIKIKKNRKEYEKGILKIWVNATLNLDYQDIWESSFFRSKLHKLYMALIKKRIKQNFEALFSELRIFCDMLEDLLSKNVK